MEQYSVLLIISGVLILVFIMVYSIKKQKQRIKMEEEEREYAELILKSKLDIQEKAFKNLRNEIQNNISQSLALARMKLNSVNNQYPCEEVNSAIDLIAKSLSDLRKINNNIKEEFYNIQTLEEGIRRYLIELKNADDFFSDLKIFGEEPEIRPEIKIILLRMIQESLSNIISYANSGIVKVSCIFKEKVINVIIDDCPSKNLNQEQLTNSIIKQIKNNSILMKTVVTIKSFPGVGTKILIEANT